MKNFKLPSIVFSAFTLLLLSACNKYDPPTAIWNANATYAVGASVSSVLPSNGAAAGVREITIVGRFSKTVDSNQVYVGSQRAMIKRMSATADTIVIYRTPNYGAQYIQVVIPAADSIRNTFPYTLENPITPYDISGIAGLVCQMEKGNGDTMWIASRGVLSMLKLDGTSLPVTYKDTSYLKPRIKNVNTDFANNFMDIKKGPHGWLYATFVSTSTISIYAMNPDSATPVVYATGFAKNQVGKFDFDDNQNLYTGNTLGMFLVKPAKTRTAVGDYAGFTFVEIRVIKDANNIKAVYAADANNIYKSLINADGTLAPRQRVFNLASDTTLTGAKISSFNFAADGTLYLSVTGGSQPYSLYVLANGTVTPYYTDNILPTGIDQLIWGGDNNMYLSRAKTGATANTRLYKIGIDRTGASYIGRGL
jgi:hypothetical protein